MLPSRSELKNPLVHACWLVHTVIRMKTYMCLICGFIYSEEEGDLEAGLAPGTRWDDVPLSWRCPDCGAGKEDFQMTEI